MDIYEAILKRKSVRAFRDREVSESIILRVLEAARLAPSACNSQPWRFVVLDDAELKNKVSRQTFGKVISFNHFTLDAPVLVVIVSERQNLTAKIGNIVRKKAFNQMDVAIAAEHFCLAATEQGLGSCILGWFDEQAVKDIIGIPAGKRVELIISVGYAESDEVRVKQRKPLEEIRSYNQY